MKRIIFIFLLLVAGSAHGQIAAPLDVTASAPIRNSDGSALPGNNPAAAEAGYTPIPGALVQILDVGVNGVADLPALDGSPGGDDIVRYTTVLGQGIAPDVADSGRFSTSFYPPPATGAKVYARIFNAPAVASATHWGQSASFVVTNVAVFDVSALGLGATTQPKGSNPATTDSDGDGQTDYVELVANTNPLDAGDRSGVAGYTGAIVSVAGRAGRAYTLLRTTDDLTSNPNWVTVQFVGVLGADANLLLSDPSPPATTKAFYRVRVTMP